MYTCLVRVVDEHYWFLNRVLYRLNGGCRYCMHAILPFTHFSALSIFVLCFVRSADVNVERTP